ncbi:hypothetical protein SAMN05421538_10179 [Paracoccus isoporae]|uniref:Cold shock protein, CspA family n=1 Tax=Paracoccus isoporae TaxID=591205 RepID=A0A1G6SUM3_9RHOB|nr:hypothetical protein [Paracoccus isoporae]SDD19805.1 hypothetical protein SAMN05421538_10179 [Paracoccus isoporae]
MIGVVIWSSESSRKAVVWCEDQGPLAYMRGSESLSQDGNWPMPGDLLRMECETVGNLRQARAVCVIGPKCCPQLPAALMGQTNRPASHLRVVARNDDPKPRASSDRQVARRRKRLSSAISS